MLIALDKGAVLEEFRNDRGAQAGVGDRRRLGRVSLPVQDALPERHLLISDFPELFLFSATYLMTLFPEREGALLGRGARRSHLRELARLRLHLHAEHRADGADAGSRSI